MFDQIEAQMAKLILEDKPIDVDKFLKETMQRRIMYLDGGMGTMIQRYRLTEEDFRGKGLLALVFG